VTKQTDLTPFREFAELREAFYASEFGSQAWQAMGAEITSRITTLPVSEVIAEVERMRELVDGFVVALGDQHYEIERLQKLIEDAPGGWEPTADGKSWMLKGNLTV